MEPLNCEVLKKNKTIWCILDRARLTSFIERLHSAHANVTKKFAKDFKDGKIKIEGITIEIDEKLIAEITGLSMEGAKFYRDRKMVDNIAIKKFLRNKKERAKLAKFDKRIYDTGNIKSI